MKFIIVIFAAFFCINFISAQPPLPPPMLEKVNRIADMINNYQGTREDLEKIMIEKMDSDHGKDMPPPPPKEVIQVFIDSVASKLNGKVMSGDDFKEFAKKQMAARGKPM